MCWCVLGRLWYSRLRCLIRRFLLFQNYILRISFCRLMSIFKHNLVKSFVWLRKHLLLITFARWDLYWPRLESRNKKKTTVRVNLSGLISIFPEWCCLCDGFILAFLEIPAFLCFAHWQGVFGDVKLRYTRRWSGLHCSAPPKSSKRSALSVHSDQGNKSAQKWKRASSKWCAAVHKQAGWGDRGLKTTSNSRAADTHSVPVLLSFPPSSPCIKATHRGTCQLTLAAEHVEVSE